MIKRTHSDQPLSGRWSHRHPKELVRRPCRFALAPYKCQASHPSRFISPKARVLAVTEARRQSMYSYQIVLPIQTNVLKMRRFRGRGFNDYLGNIVCRLPHLTDNGVNLSRSTRRSTSLTALNAPKSSESFFVSIIG